MWQRLATGAQHGWCIEKLMAASDFIFCLSSWQRQSAFESIASGQGGRGKTKDHAQLCAPVTGEHKDKCLVLNREEARLHRDPSERWIRHSPPAYVAWLREKGSRRFRGCFLQVSQTISFPLFSECYSYFSDHPKLKIMKAESFCVSWEVLCCSRLFEPPHLFFPELRLPTSLGCLLLL